MNKKHILCIITSAVICMAALIFSVITKTETGVLKIGFIFPGDGVTPYTENFMDAMDSLVKEYGDSIECVARYNVSDAQMEEFLDELIAEECNYIIAADNGYETKIKEAAAVYPDIEFCVPLGDNANEGEVLSNYHTCSGTIYQGRYVCGVVAGEKLREMIEDGTITPEQAKLGYVATYSDAQSISGYTAFYLGVQSVVPEVSMLVKYTYEWADYYKEKQAAEELIKEGCVIISQHSDTAGPAAACEASTRQVPVYHVGYNLSMTDVAPTSSLISCSVDYSYYFIQSVSALLRGKKIESCIDGVINGQDAMAGLKEGWVRILDVNRAILPEDIDGIINDTVKKLENGTIQVFSGPFTGVNPNDKEDTVDLSVPYIENEKSSAPTFRYILKDVIRICR